MWIVNLILSHCLLQRILWLQKSFFFSSLSLCSLFFIHCYLFVCPFINCIALHSICISIFSICNTKHTDSNSVCACSSHYFNSCDQVFFVWAFPAFHFYWIMFSFMICCMFTGLLAVKLWRFFFSFFPFHSRKNWHFQYILCWFSLNRMWILDILLTFYARVDFIRP